VDDIEAARAELNDRGLDVGDVQEFPVGQVRLLQRPGRQQLVGAGDPVARLTPWRIATSSAASSSPAAPTR
jgi:hypothetical protein